MEAQLLTVTLIYDTYNFEQIYQVLGVKMPIIFKITGKEES